MNDSKKYDIIDKALETLAKHKKVNLSIDDKFRSAAYPDFIHLLLKDFCGQGLWVDISDKLFDTPRQADESQTLSMDNVLMLRVAKIIFEAYSAAQNQPILTANNTSATIGSIDVTAIDTACNKIDDIEKQVDDAMVELAATRVELTEAVNELNRIRVEKSDLELALKHATYKLDQITQLLLEKGVLDTSEVWE